MNVSSAKRWMFALLLCSAGFGLTGCVGTIATAQGLIAVAQVVDAHGARAQANHSPTPWFDEARKQEAKKAADAQKARKAAQKSAIAGTDSDPFKP